MGIRFLNADFLSWFEDGFDKNLVDVGSDRPKEHYITAMRWIKEVADENNMLFKAVMPHLNNDAEVEQRYSHMVRINEDVASGGWERFNEDDRANRRDWWSQWANPMDGYAYWSQIAGRDSLILCGDFIRLNTLNTDEEKKSVITQHLVAGGPLGVSDQYHTIGDDLWLYQNEEVLALNYDGFVGKPLEHNSESDNSETWKGRMSNGDWIVAFFNRDHVNRVRSMDLKASLGLEGSVQVRDLWERENFGNKLSVSVTVPPHGVVLLRVIPE